MNARPREDAAIFDALFQGHHRVLHAFLVGQCGCAATAEDLLQETFLRAWKHIADIRAIPEERRRFYLVAAARNLVIDERRRQATRPKSAVTLDEAAHVASPAPDPAAAALASETVCQIDAAIERLAPELRTVLALHQLTEMTSGEIGDMLGIPAGTVRYRLSLARRRIAEMLDGENER